MLIAIKDIYHQTEKLSKLEKIKVGGWVKTFRQKKFIELNDGSTLNNLQIVIPENFPQKDLLEKVNFATSLVVNGRLILTPHRPQPCELKAEEIKSVNPVANDLDYQEKDTIPWINSGVLTNLFFLTEYVEPSKHVSEKVKVECDLPQAQKESVLLSCIDFGIDDKVAWVQSEKYLLGTGVWNFTSNNGSKNATLFFALRNSRPAIIKKLCWRVATQFTSIRASELNNFSLPWADDPATQTHLFVLLNSPLAKIKDLHRKIKDLLLKKYFK